MTQESRRILNEARERYGFLSETDFEILSNDPETEHILVLVRCGSFRFIAPAAQARQIIKVVESVPPNYVRDVSLFKFKE